MLEFYYDFVDFYIDQRDYELFQMDTDSLYFALSEKNLEDLIRPHLREHFKTHKNSWLSWNRFSERTPGLFKMEARGTRAIALCSKCYMVEDEEATDQTKKSKIKAKGVSPKTNNLRWEKYK